MYVPKSYYNNYEWSLERCQEHVGKGWHGLVKECYDLCVENEIDIAQIKEKFGTLRFYIISGTDYVYDKLDDICARSANICEFCGDKGKPVSVRGWIKTICERCYEEENFNK